MSHKDAIEALRASPPTLDPDYSARWLTTTPIPCKTHDFGVE
ncbi:hypothetical protein [Pseudomonas syringae]